MTLCICGCGNELPPPQRKDRPPKYMKGHINRGKHHSPTTEFKKGTPKELHPSWKGGITPLVHQIRNSNKYKDWRTQVFGRDNFTCQKCGVRGSWLEAHHIKSFSSILEDNNIKTFEASLNCKELWEINNGITYCKPCHKLLEKKSGLNGRKRY